MLFDLTKFPVGEDDVQLKDEKGNLASFKVTLIKAITADIDEGGMPIRGEEKFKRYDLYAKLKQSTGFVDLTAEDIVLLTKAARDSFPSLVAGQCRDFLKKPLPDAIQA